MAGSNLMYELAEGNPGALTAVSLLDYSQLARLKRMKLRGSMIWVGYKDICSQDRETFKRKIDDGSLEKEVMATPDWKYLHGGR